ncbi:sialoadhesin [Melanotaenia boesemani]|uniref:sialoadhesin n=1 Tax=Melanotaenia boesemani TaxID=1250792 RepID=UPI001C0423B6|nr:sialoadhesin [Melanotaenia boesemani]
MAHQCNYWLLFTLCLKGIAASDWSIHVPSSPICALIGSSVVLPCSYDYPQSSNDLKKEGQPPAQVGGNEQIQEYKVLSEMWCLGDSRCITQRYVFHSAGILPDPSYQDRVQYLGKPGTKNCSLKITNLTISDSGTYVFYLITSHPTEKMPAQNGIQLLVADSSSTVAVLAGPSTVITEGAALRLACCSPEASSQARFTWYKSTSTSLLHSGQVWNINAVSSKESGSYYCHIETGDKEQNSTTLTVNVQYPPQNTTILVWPPGELQDELPVTLTCSSDANPPVHTYIWYQGTACLPTADKSFHQGRQTLATPTGSGLTLSRANITAEEHGQHCCIARNRHGSQISSVMLKGSRAVTPSDSSGSKVLLISVTIGILLAIIAIIALLLKRRQKTNTHQSYALTETTATDP